jgi:dual-specificity kinase
VELYTGEAIFQTHEDSEHLAMMERILGKIPKSMTKRNRHTIQKYFTAEGDLNWPGIASSRSSERYVSNLFTLKEICEIHKSTENEKFYNFVRKLLEYDPSKRISATEALKDPFLQ